MVILGKIFAAFSLGIAGFSIFAAPAHMAGVEILEGVAETLRLVTLGL